MTYPTYVGLWLLYLNPKLVKNLGEVRRLTPTECERLQGFPDNWTKYGIDENGNEVPISDTQRYKQLGNAVTVNVIEAIIKEFINTEEKFFMRKTIPLQKSLGDF